MRGKQSWIIVVSEGKAKAHDIAEIINKKTKLETRVTVLGHIQRGGRPTCVDRVMGAVLGNYAIDMLCEGITDHCVHFNKGNLGLIPLSVASKKKKLNISSYYKLLKLLV